MSVWELQPEQLPAWVQRIIKNGWRFLSNIRRIKHPIKMRGEGIPSIWVLPAHSLRIQAFCNTCVLLTQSANICGAGALLTSQGTEQKRFKAAPRACGAVTWLL
jgi:hypothetical protein